MKNASFLLDTVLTLVEHKYQVGQIQPNKTDKWALTDSPCFIPNPGIFPSRIPDLEEFSIPILDQDPQHWIKIRILSIFNQKNIYKCLGIWFEIFVPDPGVKKALDPGSGIPSATLPSVLRIRLFSIPDSSCLHPRSRIRIKEFKYFNPKKPKNGF